MAKTNTGKAFRQATHVWHTLRFRFALWTGGLLLVVLAIFGTFVYFNLYRGLSASVDDALRLNASQAVAAVEVENGELDIPNSFIEGPETADLRSQGFTLRLLAPDGSVLRAFGPDRSLPVSSEALAAAHNRQSTFTTLSSPDASYPLRVYTTPITDNNQVVGIVQVTQSLAGVHETLRQLLTALLVSIPLLIVAAGWGGYTLAARALAPIDTITLTARRISAEDLSARLDLPETDDEVGRLAATLDEMLARLEEAFHRERQFTADASHELRTPLAAVQAILDVIHERRRSPDEYEQALDDIAEEATRLQSLTQSLLLLARSDMQTGASFEQVDLSTLLLDVTASLRSLAEAKRLTLTYRGTDQLMVMGDTDGLIRLFLNLLDNAIKYTEQGDVTIRASRSPDNIATIEIADTGSGISPEHLPHIFDRFYRAETSRTSPGMGLGLSIAREIARQHGGSIEVSSQISQGTTFTVHLPLIP
jgi:heavy metal sensor kinase